MADTIFFELKLKRGRNPLPVFEKLAKSVKKKGATKNWTYVIDEGREIFTVNFGDEKSEDFVLCFDKQNAKFSCKVDFPLDGELFEDEKKSEFKALLNMIYSARTSFSSMKISDDYGLAEEFMESKEFKIKLRELNEEELDRAKRLFDYGMTSYTDFALKLMYDYLEIPYAAKYEDYINQQVQCSKFQLKDNNFLAPFIETFLYETSEYMNRGRLYLDFDYFSELNGLWFSVHAFVMIMEEFILGEDYPYRNHTNCFGVKHGQVRKYYNNKFIQILEAETNLFEKCILAYRFFVSVYDFCGFKYVGRDKLLQDYKESFGAPDIPRHRFRRKLETKSFGIQVHRNVCDGFKVYATVGLSKYDKYLKDCEVIMVADDELEEALNVLGLTLVTIAGKEEKVGNSFFGGIGTVDYFQKGFEEKYNKTSLYFMKLNKFAKDCPSITDECTIYLAIFITRQECQFLEKNGYDKFEEELINKKIDIRKLDRQSMFAIEHNI